MLDVWKLHRCKPSCWLMRGGAGRLHPSLLTALMAYVYGRPNLRDVPEPETPITIELNIPKPPGVMRDERVPEGLTFDGEKFGTAVTCLAFKQMAGIGEHESSVASPRGIARMWTPTLQGKAQVAA